MNIRTRLLLALSIALALGAGAFLWWTETELSDHLREVARTELHRDARMVSAAIGDRVFSDTLADRLGRAAGRRVTLIGPGGAVLGDSEIPRERLPTVGDHADRPEVRAALAGRVGTAERVSATLSRAFQYTAIPHGQGVVRLAVPTGTVRDPIVRIRRRVLAAGVLAVLLAIGASGILTRFVLRPVRRLRDSARAVAEGDLSHRIRPEGDGEVEELGRAIDRITERTENLVERLTRERDDLSALFENLDLGIAVIDGEGRVVRANSAFGARAGRVDVEGRRLGTLFRTPEVMRTARRALEGDRSTREIHVGERALHLSASPHHEGALLVFRDLTRLRKLEGVRRDFVANVSHELKTPLTSMIGFAEAIGHGDLSAEERRRFGERILANARRMQALVDDLLELSRLESGVWEPDIQQVELEPLARREWENQLAMAEGVEVDLELRLEGPAVLSVDREALRQILRNLFDNALRHAPESSRVTLSCERGRDGVRIEVSDTGRGIPSIHHERLFERFYRVDAGRSRQAGGTGLGLSIIKHLVAAHGGEVGVESGVGRGTTVWFTLPA